MTRRLGRGVGGFEGEDAGEDVLAENRDGVADLEALGVGERCAEVVAKLNRVGVEILERKRSDRQDFANAGDKHKEIDQFMGERVFAVVRADDRFEQLFATLLRVEAEDMVRQRELKRRLVRLG